MRDLILEYIDVDSFIEGQTNELRQNFEAQFGESVPANYVEAIEAFKQALIANRRWFEDKLVETFPKEIDEDFLRKVIAFRKTELVKTLIHMDGQLTRWAADLNAQWLQETPQIKAAFEKLVGIEAPAPIPLEQPPAA